MPLFEVAVLRVEENEKTLKRKETVVLAPQSLLAHDANQAKLKAARLLTAKDAEDLDDLVVLVRPFS